jgi:hypothetical protein
LAKDNLNLRLPNFKDVKGVISDESRIRMSENHPSKHNKEWLEKTKERLAAQSKNKDIVEKIRQKNKGTKRPTTSKKNIEYQSRLSKEEKIEIANKRKQTILSKNNGKWHTDEFRLNMSKRLKGVSLSIEHKQKLSKNHGLKRKVINIITSEVYDSAAKAAEKNGMVYGTLVSKLIGRRKNNTNLKYYEG